MKLSTLNTLSRILVKQGAGRLASILKHMGLALQHALHVMRQVVSYSRVNWVA